MKTRISIPAAIVVGLLVIGFVLYLEYWMPNANHQLPSEYRDSSGTVIVLNPYDHTKSATGDGYMEKPGEPKMPISYQDDHKARLLILIPNDTLASSNRGPWLSNIHTFLLQHSNYQLAPNDQSFVLDGDQFVRAE